MESEIATLRADLAKAREEVERLTRSWLCYQCGERFMTEEAAQDHFTDWDERPCCVDPVRTDEKLRLQELRYAREAEARWRREAEDANEERALLASFKSEIGRYFGQVGGVAASTPHQAWLRFEAEQGRAEAAEAALATTRQEVDDWKRISEADKADSKLHHDRALAAERARDEAVAEVARLKEALELSEPFLAYAAEPEPCYGSFHGGDPRDFTPDPECSTEEEREKHRRACELWEAQAEPMALRDTHSIVKSEAGEVVGHVARSGFGLGTYLHRDKRAVKALDAARRALGRTDGEG